MVEKTSSPIKTAPILVELLTRLRFVFLIVLLWFKLQLLFSVCESTLISIRTELIFLVIFAHFGFVFLLVWKRLEKGFCVHGLSFVLKSRLLYKELRWGAYRHEIFLVIGRSSGKEMEPLLLILLLKPWLHLWLTKLLIHIAIWKHFV